MSIGTGFKIATEACRMLCKNRALLRLLMLRVVMMLLFFALSAAWITVFTTIGFVGTVANFLNAAVYFFSETTVTMLGVVCTTMGEPHGHTAFALLLSLLLLLVAILCYHTFLSMRTMSLVMRAQGIQPIKMLSNKRPWAVFFIILVCVIYASLLAVIYRLGVRIMEAQSIGYTFFYSLLILSHLGGVLWMWGQFFLCQTLTYEQHTFRSSTSDAFRCLRKTWRENIGISLWLLLVGFVLFLFIPNYSVNRILTIVNPAVNSDFFVGLLAIMTMCWILFFSVFFVHVWCISRCLLYIEYRKLLALKSGEVEHSSQDEGTSLL